MKTKQTTPAQPVDQQRLVRRTCDSGLIREVVGVEAANTLEADTRDGKWVMMMSMKRKDKNGSEYPVFVYRLWLN